MTLTPCGPGFLILREGGVSTVCPSSQAVVLQEPQLRAPGPPPPRARSPALSLQSDDCQNPRLALKPLNSHFPATSSSSAVSPLHCSAPTTPPGRRGAASQASFPGSPSHRSLGPRFPAVLKGGIVLAARPGGHPSVPYPPVFLLDAVNGQFPGVTASATRLIPGLCLPSPISQPEGLAVWMGVPVSLNTFCFLSLPRVSNLNVKFT